MELKSQRPIDRFVERSQNILQKEYLVIGKTRVSRLTSWTVLAFFLGMTLAIGFLASRTGTFEGSEAAKSPAPKWSSWSKAQEGTCEGKTSAVQQCKGATLKKTVIGGGKGKVPAFQTRSCTKKCESLAGAQFQQQGQVTGGSGDAGGAPTIATCTGSSSQSSYATINWTNPTGYTGSYIVDIDDNGNFGDGFWNKGMSGVTNTVAPDGFNGFGGKTGSPTLTPGSNYWVRVFYPALGSSGTHSNTATFTAQPCSATDEIKLDLRYLRGTDSDGFIYYKPNVTSVGFYREIKPRHFLGVNTEDDFPKLTLKGVSPVYDAANKILTWSIPIQDDSLRIPLSSKDLSNDDILLFYKACPTDTKIICNQSLGVGPDNISFSHTAGIPQTIRVYGTPKGNFKLSGSFLTGKGGLDFSFDEIFRSDLFSITISVCGESGWCFGVPIPIGRIFDALFPKKAPYAYNDKSDGQIPGSDWALDCGRKRSVHINVPLDSNLGKRIISAGNSLSQALGGIFTFDFVYDPNLEIINPNTRLKQIPTELSGGQSECVVDNTSLCGADRQGIMGLILNSDQSQLLFCNQTKNDKEFQSLVKALSADGSKCALAATISGGWGNGDNNQTFVFRTGIIGMIQQWAFDLSDPKQSKIFNALIADRLLHFIVKNPGDFFGYDDNFNPVINGKLVDEISRVFPHCANVAKQQSSSCKPIPPGQVGDACHPAPPSVEQ